MIKYFSIFFKIILSLILGLFINLILLQEDPWLKELIEHKIEKIFYNIIESPCLFKISKINLFARKIIFDSLYAFDKSQKWEFKCQNLIIDFSLRELLFTSKIITDFTFNNLEIQTNFEDGNLSISKPLKLIASAPFLFPCLIKHLTLKELTLKINESANIIETKIPFYCIDSFFALDSIDTTIIFNNGFFQRNNKRASSTGYMQNISGYLNFNIGTKYCNLTQMDGRITTHIPNKTNGSEKYTFFCNYKNEKGWAEIQSSDRLFHAKISNILNISKKIIMDININTNLQKIAQLAQYELPQNEMCPTGNLNFTCHLNIGQDVIGIQGNTPMSFSYNAKLIGKDFSYDAINLKNLNLIINGNEKNLYGTLDLYHPESLNISTSCQYDIFNNALKTKLILNEPIELGSYKINQGIAAFKVESNNCLISSDYAIHLTNQNKKGAQPHVDSFSGKILFDGHNINALGQLNNMKYIIESCINPLSLKKIELRDKEQKLIELSTGANPKNKGTCTASDEIKIKIDYQLIKEIIQTILSYDLNGEGNAIISIQRTPGIFDNQVLKGSLKLENSSIRIPYMYNLIKNINVNFIFDWKNKSLVFQDLFIDLYKGQISSLECTLICNHLAKLLYMHLPVTYKNCLITWKKDFFSLFSGTLTLIYNKTKNSLLKGRLFLDHAYLRSNLLSSKVQQDIFSATIRSLNNSKDNINLNIDLLTQNPLQVKTPFLQAKASLNLKVKGTLFNPEMYGQIELLQGSFAFPYKPLYIMSGKIYLNPETDSPTIELIAKSRLKKYNITMSITGSIEQPRISFESSPNLQEEQIITLLLSGSEEGSLYFLMPNLIMQNLETLFFGSVENSSKLQQYFKNILKPLKNIRLIAPNEKMSQNNIAKVPGPAPAIEFDLSDKLRAKVQNNLNLSDQTQLELEYNISDDISVKAIKDEQGQIGGEIEMRWKF